MGIETDPRVRRSTNRATKSILCGLQPADEFQPSVVAPAFHRLDGNGDAGAVGAARRRWQRLCALGSLDTLAGVLVLGGPSSVM